MKKSSGLKAYLLIFAIFLILSSANSAENNMQSYIVPQGCDWTTQNVPFLITCESELHEETEHVHNPCPEGTRTYYAVVDSYAMCPQDNFVEANSGEVTCNESSACTKKVCFYSEIAGLKEDIKESGEFKIDKAKPSIIISAVPEESGGRKYIRISASCTDVGSGCGALQYKTNEKSQWLKYTGQIKVEKIEKIFFKAVDNAGNETLIEKDLALKPDTDKPTKPGSLNASLENGFVVLRWLASTDEGSGLQGYKIFRVIGNTSNEIGFTQETFFKDKWIPSGETISYRVVALDFAGNYSEANEISLNFSTETELTEISHKSGWYNRPFKVLLKCIYEKGCSKTLFRINGGSWQQGTEIEIRQQGRYEIEFYSIGNDNLVEKTRKAWFGLDTEAPRINSLALSLEAGVIKLSWNSPQDKQSGLAKFIIYKNGSQLAETKEKSFSDGDFQSGKTYEYSVVAIDVAGNKSEPVSKAIEIAPEPSILPYLLAIFLIFFIIGLAIIVVRRMRNPYRF